jgi:hypothetical protein
MPRFQLSIMTTIVFSYFHAVSLVSFREPSVPSKSPVFVILFQRFETKHHANAGFILVLSGVIVLGI